MMRWIPILGLLLFAGCESFSQSSTYSTGWQDSSFRNSSWHDYHLFPRSVTLPSKPISQMNEEELRQTTRAINLINRVNMENYLFHHDHFQPHGSWIHKP